MYYLTRWPGQEHVECTRSSRKKGGLRLGIIFQAKKQHPES